MTDWQGVVGRHTGLVWQTANRLLGNYDDADDCAQETFLAALEAARRQPVGHWAGFLARLCTCRALDRLRQRTRHAGRHEHPPDWADVASDEAGPDEEAQAAELAQRLRTALAELPPQEAEVVCLRCLHGLSYGQIASDAS